MAAGLYALRGVKMAHEWTDPLFVTRTREKSSEFNIFKFDCL